MAGDEPMRGGTVTVLAPALGQHVFFLRFQHREPPDFLEISGKAVFSSDDRQRSSMGHDCALHSVPPVIGGPFAPTLCKPPEPSFVQPRNLTIATAAYRTKGGETKMRGVTSR